MLCFLFPILPTSSCLFNGNYLQILRGEAFYVNKICLLNWLSFSFLLQIYLPAYPPTHTHHWSHPSPCTLVANAPGCRLQLKNCPTRSWGHTEHPERPRSKKWLRLWTLQIPSCFFSDCFQDDLVGSHSRAGLHGSAGNMRSLPCPTAPGLGAAQGGRMLLPPSFYLFIPEISLRVHSSVAASCRASPSCPDREEKLSRLVWSSGSFCSLSLFIFFFTMHPALHKQCVLTSYSYNVEY